MKFKILISTISLLIIAFIAFYFFGFKKTWFKEMKITVLSINELNKINPKNIHYTKIYDQIKLNFSTFPIASSEDSTYANPIIPETFVLRLPKASVYSDKGYTLINKKFMVSELIWPWSSIKKQGPSFQNLPKSKKLKGSMVVLAQEGHGNYYHWITEIIPKLALLKDITYDWLYLPRLDLPFQAKTLNLLGIDPKKIIEANANTFIQADEVIIPSYVSKSCYTPEWVTDYLKEKFLSPTAFNNKTFSSKVFISRQKAPQRRITNEDDIFKTLEPLGYKKYHLEDLDFTEQINLFSQANHIVAAHGAGLTNIIFCKPNTHIIELFQEREDDTYCYLSQTMKLNYTCLKTTEFTVPGNNDTDISPKLFLTFFEKNLDKF